MVIFIEKTMELRLKYADFETKINFKEFTKNFFDFSFGSLITEAINIESTNESIAFSLLFNTTKTTFANESQRLGQDELNKSSNLIALSNLFLSDLKELYEQEVIITEDFFNNTIKHNKNYLNLSYKIFKKFIKELKIDEPEAYFLDFILSFQKALLEEYNNDEKYQKLGELFNSPLIEENKNLKSLINNYKVYKSYYTERLQKNISENKETLKELYIEPFFSVYSNNIKNNAGNYGDFKALAPKISIHNYISNYFLIDKKHSFIKNSYSMLFILGQPGQGKTSLCYKLIYDYISQNEISEAPLIFLKIRELDTKGFINNPFETINKFSDLGFNVNFSSDSCFLVLDGLDEAYMSGGIRDNDLSNLYERLNKTAKQNKFLKIIITSRLNYLNLSNHCIDGSLVLQLEGLTNIQIKKYAKKFTEFHPESNFSKKISNILPKKKKEVNPIIELLRQTVLLYFIGISDIELNKDDSKIKVYSKLFETISKRSWDSNGQLSYFKNSLKNDPKKYNTYLRKYIRAIAFAIYQSENLYITINELTSLESSKTFARKSFDTSILDDYNIIKETNKYLLISFYFQNAKGDDNDAIEFFHNSLWEFLTAEYIWEEFKALVIQKDEDGDLKPIKLIDYFDFLEKIIGNKELNLQIELNIKEVINNENEHLLLTIYNQIKSVFYKLSDQDFLLFYNYKIEKLTSFQKFHNIFKLSWLLIQEMNIKANDEKIFINEKLTRHLFNFDGNFSVDKNFSNLYFTNNSIMENAGVYACNFNNNYFSELQFTDCVFVGNTISNSVFDSCHMHRIEFFNNKFSDNTFEKCLFLDETFENNDFKNLKFIEVVVYEKNWLELFLKNNKVDKNLDNFTISKAKGETYYINTK